MIYMMSILSDPTLRVAGFDSRLRDGIAAAWKDEDYHRAAEMIPDELLDTLILCGTVDEVAARALLPRGRHRPAHTPARRAG